ncbi:hypothetical protein [Actinoallomurus sp. NPDC050550]|uniref:hypothetical protein n=1 Tax=Actinoallomurus sp. NPDC050550 TaxID=3154937 RepID=UPI0033E89E80
MRKPAVIVAAAIAVIGAGASTASAATIAAKPKLPHSWDLGKKVKPADARTKGHWARKDRTFTITGNIQDYSPGDTGVASVIVRVKLSGKAQKAAKYRTDTPKGRTFTVKYTVKKVTQVGKVTISVQKCLDTAAGDHLCSKETPVK